MTGAHRVVVTRTGGGWFAVCPACTWRAVQYAGTSRALVFWPPDRRPHIASHEQAANQTKETQP